MCCLDLFWICDRFGSNGFHSLLRIRTVEKLCTTNYSMTTEIPLSERRGFQFSSLEANSIGILLVKASIELVSPATTKLFGGNLELNVLGKQSDSISGSESLVYQYRGHPWSIVFPIVVCAERKVSRISKLLKTRCIYLQHEDTSSCSGYHLFNKGKCVEEFSWGVDYTEDIFEISPQELTEYAEKMEAQGTPLSDAWNPKKWDIYITNGTHVGYKFRSEECEAEITEDHLRDEKAFLDFLLRNQDAWLPDYKYLPHGEIAMLKDAMDEDFERVDRIIY